MNRSIDLPYDEKKQFQAFKDITNRVNDPSSDDIHQSTPKISDSNRRLHVRFYHSGVVAWMTKTNEMIRSLLYLIWSEFGEVESVSYHREFCYALVTFSSTQSANEAFETLQGDTIFLRKVIKKAMNAMEDEKEAARVATLLFPGGRLLQPTWAANTNDTK